MHSLDQVSTQIKGVGDRVTRAQGFCSVREAFPQELNDKDTRYNHIAVVNAARRFHDG